ADLLERRLPPGLELDTRDGRAFASLVAFDFLDTRVLGVPWPGYRDFTELNLRFYVHRGLERGVVFVREFVPHRLARQHLSGRAGHGISGIPAALGRGDAHRRRDRQEAAALPRRDDGRA